MSKWILLLTAVALIQATFVAAITSWYPLLTVVVLFIASSHVSRAQLLGLSLWTGLILDSLSLQIFGVYMVMYLGVWLLISLMYGGGLELHRGLGLVAAFSLVFGWLLAVDMVLTYILSGSAYVLISGWLLQLVISIIFAFPFRKQLQLR